MNLRVKEICKEKGILFKDLADCLNITDVGLRKQVQGNPTLETLYRIADALNVSITELFEPSKSDTASLACPHCGKTIKVKIDVAG